METAVIVIHGLVAETMHYLQVCCVLRHRDGDTYACGWCKRTLGNILSRVGDLTTVLW